MTEDGVHLNIRKGMLVSGVRSSHVIYGHRASQRRRRRGQSAGKREEAGSRTYTDP